MLDKVRIHIPYFDGKSNKYIQPIATGKCQVSTVPFVLDKEIVLATISYSDPFKMNKESKYCFCFICHILIKLIKRWTVSNDYLYKTNFC